MRPVTIAFLSAGLASLAVAGWAAWRAAAFDTALGKLESRVATLEERSHPASGNPFSPTVDIALLRSEVDRLRNTIDTLPAPGGPGVTKGDLAAAIRDALRERAAQQRAEESRRQANRATEQSGKWLEQARKMLDLSDEQAGSVREALDRHIAGYAAIWAELPGEGGTVNDPATGLVRPARLVRMEALDAEAGAAIRGLLKPEQAARLSALPPHWFDGMGGGGR